jgi:hypothetical protein
VPTTTGRLEHEIGMLHAELQEMALLPQSQRQEPTAPPFWSLN